MTANTFEPEARGAAEQKPKSNGQKTVKILMIHGQSPKKLRQLLLARYLT